MDGWLTCTKSPNVAHHNRVMRMSTGAWMNVLTKGKRNRIEVKMDKPASVSAYM